MILIKRGRLSSRRKNGTFLNAKKGGDKNRISLVFVLVYQSVQMPESIEWFIEDQAFSLSFDFAPPNLLSQTSCGFPVGLTDKGGGGGGGAKSYDGQKAWSSINHSILSDRSPTAIPWNTMGHPIATKPANRPNLDRNSMPN